MEGEEANIDVWSHALECVKHSLESGKRLFVEDAARKLKILLTSPAAIEPTNIVEVLYRLLPCMHPYLAPTAGQTYKKTELIYLSNHRDFLHCADHDCLVC